MRAAKILLTVIIFCLLTVLTQVGGLVYFVSLSLHSIVNRKFGNKYMRRFLKVSIFLFFYLLATFVIVPLIAKSFGRTRLPLTQTNNLQPLNILTCLLNRNYVRPELKQATFEVAKKMNDKFPGTTINYLDANFPFLDGFPLIPHLSHNDGKKLDLSFCYMDSKKNTQTNKCPSFIGYGICEEPLSGEINTADICSKGGHWQYSFLKKIIPQGNKQNYLLDNERTKELVNLFAAKGSIGKIFIEPHLKARLNLGSSKIRFHGCQAVRHDDHIHVQLN